MRLDHVLHSSVAFVPQNSLLVYFFLVADSLHSKNADIRSTLTPAEIAALSNLPVSSVTRGLDDLRRREWIRVEDGYVQTGYFRDGRPYWLAKIPKIRERLLNMKPTIAFLQHRDESLTPYEVVVTNDIKSRIRVRTTKPKAVVEAFRRGYKETFNQECPLVDDDYKKTCAYITRAAKWTGGHDKTIDLIEFLFRNWEKIAKRMKLDGPLSFHMIGSSKIMPRFLDFYIKGIPRDGFTDRYVPSEKDSGW